MSKKLLLLKDVEKLGRSGDLVNAKPGFIRNYLVPQGYAVYASKQTLRQQALLQEKRRQQAINDQRESQEVAARMQEVTLVSTQKVDHEGHMYGSVSAVDIVHLLKEQASIEIDKRCVQLKHPIKEIGVHTIAVKLKEGVSGEVVLKVIAEGGMPAEETAPAAAKE